MSATRLAPQRSPRVELRCRKCFRRGRAKPYVFDTVWMEGDRLCGLGVVTDLAEEIEALEAGRPYRTPAWRTSSPYIAECERKGCGNRPDLKYDTLKRMVADAIRSWELALYI